MPIGGNLVTRSLVGTRLVGGTWTASGTWTPPAFTLGGDITMNDKYLDCGDSYLQVKTTAAGKGPIYRSIQNGPTGTFLQLRHESATPAVSDYQKIYFTSRDGAGVIIEHGHFIHNMTNVTNGAETAEFKWGLASAGAASTAKMVLSGAGLLTPEGGLDLKGNYATLLEMAAPGAGAADEARIYAYDSGGGLTGLAGVFQDGTVDQFAVETTPRDSPIFTQSSGVEVKEKMIKPHPGLIQFVKVYSNGKTFVTRRIEYHDAEKIAANKGCEGPLPQDWEVTTLQERVDKQLAILDERDNTLSASLVRLEKMHKANATKLKKLTAGEEKEALQEQQVSILADIENAKQGQTQVESKKQLEIARLK